MERKESRKLWSKENLKKEEYLKRFKQFYVLMTLDMGEEA